MLIVTKAVEAHVHDLGRQINGEAMPALNECVRMILEDAILATRGKLCITAFEIYYAAGRSALAIKPKGR